MLALAVASALTFASDDGAAVPLTPLDADDDPCELLLADDHAEDEHECRRIAQRRIAGLGRVALYRLREEGGDTELALTITAPDGSRAMSTVVSIAAESKLCNQHSWPIQIRPRLRAIRRGVALEVRVLNQRNRTDSGRCATIGYRRWRGRAFLVCDGDACTFADHDDWLAPCDAWLSRRGVVHSCQGDRAMLPP